MPCTAFAAGLDFPPEIAGRAMTYLGWTAFTYPFNLTGMPAATVPCGFAVGWVAGRLATGRTLARRWRRSSPHPPHSKPPLPGPTSGHRSRNDSTMRIDRTNPARGRAGAPAFIGAISAQEQPGSALDDSGRPGQRSARPLATQPHHRHLEQPLARCRRSR